MGMDYLGKNISCTSKAAVCGNSVPYSQTIQGCLAVREPFLVVCRLKTSTGLLQPCPLVSGGLSDTPDKPKPCARWLLLSIDTLVPAVLAPVYLALCSDRAHSRVSHSVHVHRFAVSQLSGIYLSCTSLQKGFFFG